MSRTRAAHPDPFRCWKAAVYLVTTVAVNPLPSIAQDAPRAGVEVAGLPALNYDADEGFGYGAIAELYDYGEGDMVPYRFTLQPTVFFTTGGRRDFTLFFDSPHLLPGGWRVDASLGSEKQIASPYYGVGNDTPYDEAADAEDGPNPYYYRFGRTRRRASINVQHSLGDTPLRFLAGAGLAKVSIVAVPEGQGTTLLADHIGQGSAPGGWSNHVRAGLIWDSRDRETGPTRGTWSELLVQRVDEALGSDARYTRWTFTDRRYVPLTHRLVLANRILVQGIEGDPPFYDLYLVQTSFKQQEGLGGANTLRGIPKNRYVGKDLVLWNVELRWRAAEFRMLGRSFHATLSAFVDQGRVWEENMVPGEIFADLHRGYGGGVRVGMGENFVVAVDVGTSVETTAPIYIGLGYLY